MSFFLIKMNDFTNINYRSINARILNTERIYGKDSPIVKRIYDTIERAYGVKGLTRFKKYDTHKITFAQEIAINSAYEKVLNNKYTSAAGRKELADNWKSSFRQSHLHWTDERIGKLQDLFTNTINWQRIREIVKDYGSDIFVELVTSTNDNQLDAEQLDQLFEAYLQNSDYNSSYPNFNEVLMDFISSDSEGREAMINRLNNIE